MMPLIAMDERITSVSNHSPRKSDALIVMILVR